MIIGKSLTALGGGGLKPEIRVTAKAGALLNLHFKNSSIILQSYQLGASETTHTFVVNVSETAYVVEDVTNGASVEVLVDAVSVFEAEIQYTLWLYRDGDECEDITGGWTINGYAPSDSKFIVNQAFTKNENNMSSTSPTTSLYFNIIGTSEIIDTSGYNTMYADATVLNKARKVYQLDVSKQSNIYSSFGILHYDDGSSIAFGYISNSKTIVIGGANLGSLFYLSKTYSSSDRVTIHRVWLE